MCTNFKVSRFPEKGGEAVEVNYPFLTHNPFFLFFFLEEKFPSETSMKGSNQENKKLHIYIKRRSRALLALCVQEDFNASKYLS